MGKFNRKNSPPAPPKILGLELCITSKAATCDADGILFGSGSCSSSLLMAKNVGKEQKKMAQVLEPFSSPWEMIKLLALAPGFGLAYC